MRVLRENIERKRLECGAVGSTTSEDLLFSIRGIFRIAVPIRICARVAAAILNARTVGVDGLEFHADNGLSYGRHLTGLDGLKGGAVALLDPIESVKGDRIRSSSTNPLHEIGSLGGFELHFQVRSEDALLSENISCCQWLEREKETNLKQFSGGLLEPGL